MLQTAQSFERSTQTDHGLSLLSFDPCSELHADGIDTSLLLREANHPSPFTYIIVDRAGEQQACSGALQYAASVVQCSTFMQYNTVQEAALCAA